MKMSGLSCHGGSVRSGPFTSWLDCLRGKNPIIVPLTCLVNRTNMFNNYIHYIKPSLQVWKPRQHNQRVRRVCWTFPQRICSSCSAGKNFRRHNVSSSSPVTLNCMSCEMHLTNISNSFVYLCTRCCWKSYTSTRKSSMWLPEYSNRPLTTSTRA